MGKRFFFWVGLLCLVPFLPTAAQIVISEVFYDTPLYEKMRPKIGVDLEGIHHNGEFVELYNNSAASVDLSGYSIGVLYVNYPLYFFPDGTICKSKESLIIAFRHPNSPNFSLKELFPEIPSDKESKIFYHSSFILGNDGNTVILKNKEDRIVSYFGYDKKQAINGKEPYKSLHKKELSLYPRFQQYTSPRIGSANPFKFEDVDSYERTLGEMMPTNRCNVANPNKTVGEIKTNTSVSPGGGAIVDVSLVFPPGINGMEPKLSVQYNSQGGMGALGVGTDLAGLSSISRSNENMYFDGKRSLIKFQKGGPYVMDGQKLVQVIPGKYETYVYSLTKIEEVGESGNGPLYFRVTSPQGVVAEYGSEPSGRVYASDNANILAWKISKITDPNGNCITYKYTTEREKGSYIKEIIYGENSQNKIEFDYVENKVSPSTCYIDGSFFCSKMLLSGIWVNAGASGYLKYEFNYSDDRLFAINENGLNGEKLSVDYAWGASSTTNNQETILNASELDGGTFLSGDLNGDGQMDLLRLCTHKEENYLEPFIKEGGQFVGKQALRLPDNVFGKYVTGTFQLYNSLDVNNDGKSEVLILKKVVQNDNSFSYTIMAYSYSDGNWQFIKDIIQSVSYGEDPEIKPIIVNTNNDIPEFTFIYKNGNYLKANFNRPVTGLEQPPRTSLPINNINKVLPIDYNGDGISELLIRSNNKWHLANLNSSENSKEIFSDENYTHAKVLDLNNDGLEDIVFISNSAKLCFFTNKGNKEFDKYYLSADTENKIIEYLPLESLTEIINFELIQSDFNNDNNPEIILHLNIKGYIPVPIPGYPYPEFYVLLDKDISFTGKLKKRNSNEYEVAYFVGEEGWNKQILSTDSNNDGIADWVEIREGKDVVANTVNVGKRKLLTSISNNGVKRASFDYGYASDKNLHSCPNNEIPSSVKYLNIPYPLVTSTSQPNGIGGQITTSYKYYNGKFHSEGLGALGFEKVEQTTRTGGISRKQTIESILDNATFMTKRQTSKSYINNIACESQTVDMDISKSSTGKIICVQKKSEIAYNLLEGSQKRTEYTYDAAKRINSEKVTYDDNSYIKTDYSDYNTYNQPVNICVTRKHYQNASSFFERTRNIYDEKSNLVTSIANLTSQTPVTTNYTYYSNGLIKSKKTTAQGVETVEESYAYEMGGIRNKISKSNIFSTTNSYYNPLNGNLEEEAVSLKGILTPQTTRYTYDGLGREKEIIYPNGKKMERELGWSTADRGKYYYKTIEKMAGESPVTKWFDVLGREIYSTSKQGDVLAENATIYDEDGRKISEISMHPQKCSWTDYTYYPDGRLEEVLTHTGKTQEYSYNKRTVRTSQNGKVFSKTMDSWGNILQQTDPDNTTIIHTYNANGQPMKTTVGTHTITMSYDDKGNQLQLNDPDIGNISYTYDAYNRIKTYKAPKGSYSATYDNYGRIKQKAFSSRIVDYTYYDSGNGIGLLKNAKVNNGTEESYAYNLYGQVLTKTQKIDNQTFTYENVYDNWGRLTKHTSPSGYQQNYTYTSSDSRLFQVTDQAGKKLWQYVKNIPGREEEYKLGNFFTCLNLSSQDEIQRDMLCILAGNTILVNSYGLDPLMGNMVSRAGKYDGRLLTEKFEYDNMDRLVKVSGKTSMDISFDSNGNITGKSDVGAYQYESTRAHAVTGIEEPTEELRSKSNQTITYTEFNKVESISEGGYEMKFTYGPDEQRVKSQLYRNGACVRTIYYGEGFERQTDGNGRIRQYSYLSADGGVFGMAVKDMLTLTTQVYYLHSDLLGSLVAISDASGNIVERRSFDAWGRKRNPDNWSDYKNVPQSQLSLLGYTFQEEMPEFGLINLNGRLYDPFLGRMLSPDPFIQDPGNSQNYNRYSYCWNNPMKYTDPNGNFILGFFFPGIGNVIDAMLWSGLSYSIQAKDNWDFGPFIGSMVKGGVLGGLSMGTSSMIGEIMGHSLGSPGVELLRSGLHGVTGGGLSVLSGGKFLDGFAAGTLSSLAGSAMQGMGVSSTLGLGLGGGIAGGVTSAIIGGDIGMGFFQGFMVGMFNHGQEDPPVKFKQSIANKDVAFPLNEVVIIGRDLSNIKNIRNAIASFAVSVPGADMRKYGHAKPNVDCSQFALEVAGKFGFKIPRTVVGQIEWFKQNAYYSTDPSKIQPGDQLFYSNDDHTGVAVNKKGRLGIVHATVRNYQKGSIIFSPISSEGHILNFGTFESRWAHIFVGFGRYK